MSLDSHIFCKSEIHRVSFHLWVAITSMHVNGFWYFFGRNVTDKVSNQKTLYYATSNNLCFCTTWQNGETQKLHFSLKCCISALPEFNQSLLDFFNFFESWLILLLLYDSLCLVINAFSHRDCWGHWFNRKEVDSTAAVGLCCMHNAPVGCLLGFLFHKVMQKH